MEMKKGRIEIFSDGVFAITITIMVLELKVPHEAGLSGLKALLPIFLSYVLSFINVGIFWNHHHHLFQVVEFIDGKVLWANLHFLFWITLLPFSSGWMGENNFLLWTVILYGIILLMVTIAYAILIKSLLVLHKETSPLTLAVGKDKKIRRTILLYLAGIGLAFVSAYIASAIYLLVAALWLIPDKKIEDKLETEHPSKKEPEEKN